MIHKVDNIGIFVQFLIKMDSKQLRVKYVSLQNYICYSVLNNNWSDGFLCLIFKLKQYKNANTANFVYYGKTLLETQTLGVNCPLPYMELRSWFLPVLCIKTYLSIIARRKFVPSSQSKTWRSPLPVLISAPLCVMRLQSNGQICS